MENDLFVNQVLVRGYSDVYEKEYARKDRSTVRIENQAVVCQGRRRYADHAGGPYQGRVTEVL